MPTWPSPRSTRRVDAVNGKDKFPKKLPIRALAVMYPNLMQVVTLEGNGITKFEDLKGKRVSTGSPGSGTEIFAFRVIEAAGLDKDKDMSRERLSAAESANALKDKKIDAFMFVAGVPTAAITDVAATPGRQDAADRSRPCGRRRWWKSMVRPTHRR